MPAKLRVRWSKKENDFMVHFPRSADGHLAHHYLCSEWPPAFEGQPWAPSFVDELKRRGYDMTTLKFSIEMKE